MENLTPYLRNVGKTEMARIYHPCDHVTDETARRWLNREIQKNVRLRMCLENNGYNKYQHFFTPVQVMIIITKESSAIDIMTINIEIF